MGCSRNLFVPLIAVAGCVAALAQTPTYNVGRTPTAEELRVSDVSIGPLGKELPPGSGTAKEGAKIYAQKCAACHGPNGTKGEARLSANGGPVAPPLVGGKGTSESLRGWPFATTIWDYINKAMPLEQERSLKADEVYALTAFLLSRNGIIQENELLDATSLPKIQMPDRNNFVPSPWPEPDMKAYHARCRIGVCP